METVTIMDILRRWPHSIDARSTSEVMAACRLEHAAAYRWLMKLATSGYFSRENRPLPVGGRVTYWTITPKGRAAITELERIYA